MKYYVTIGERAHEVELIERLGKLEVIVDDKPLELSYDEADRLGQVVLLHDGRSYAISIEGGARQVGVTLAGHYYGCELEDERERAAQLAAGALSSVLELTHASRSRELLLIPAQDALVEAARDDVTCARLT